MKLLGQKVLHKTFGEGIILTIDNEHVKVSFSNDKKVFIFPDAFRTYLSAVDSSVQDCIDKKLKQKDEEKMKSISESIYVGQVLYCENDETVVVNKIYEKDIELEYKGKNFLRSKLVVGEKLFIHRCFHPSSDSEGPGKEFWPKYGDATAFRYGINRNR